jgi:hypothetical protein
VYMIRDAPFPPKKVMMTRRLIGSKVLTNVRLWPLDNRKFVFAQNVSNCDKRMWHLFLCQGSPDSTEVYSVESYVSEMAYRP